jgi:DHA2 family multidrug resistance protein
MPLTGFLGGFFGQKRVYVISMILFVTGSALCGTARTLPVLIAYRVMQGLAGGALQPTQQAILRTTFPPEEQGMAMAIFSMVVMIGPAIGNVLGGVITDQSSWPWIFYINVPIGIIGIIMTVQNVHEYEDVRAANRARAQAARKNLDVSGMMLMMIAIGSLQYLFEQGPQDDWFDSIGIRIAAFLCAVSFIGFIIRELTAKAPVVNLRLFKDMTFTSATVIAFIMFGMLMGSMFLLPIFCEESLHYTATLTGIVLIPRTLAMMALSPVVGKIYNKVQPAVIVAVGVVLFVIGSYTFSKVTLETSAIEMVVPLVITGFAFACLFVPLTTAALSRTPRHLMADAAGLNSFCRQIGGSVGLTIFATLFTNFGVAAYTSVSSHVTLLRPEVVSRLGQMRAGMATHGIIGGSANALAGMALGGRVMAQSSVLAFDRVFMLQGVLFLIVIPLCFFMRVPRTFETAAGLELPME